jgi:hypothetical protein
METTRGYIFWTGPENDVLMLLREPTPLWLADPVDDEYQFLILLALNETEEETGEIAGIKILDFLKFDRWNEIPEFPILWELEDQKPSPMVELLKRVQIQCRKEAETLISAG